MPYLLTARISRPEVMRLPDWGPGEKQHARTQAHPVARATRDAADCEPEACIDVWLGHTRPNLTRLSHYGFCISSVLQQAKSRRRVCDRVVIQPL